MHSFIFVKNVAGVSEKGKPYNMVMCSNGLAMLPPIANPHNIDLTDLKEGDRVNCEVKLGVDYKGNFTAELVGIEKE